MRLKQVTLRNAKLEEVNVLIEKIKTIYDRGFTITLVHIFLSIDC